MNDKSTLSQQIEHKKEKLMNVQVRKEKLQTFYYSDEFRVAGEHQSREERRQRLSTIRDTIQKLENEQELLQYDIRNLEFQLEKNQLIAQLTKENIEWEEKLQKIVAALNDCNKSSYEKKQLEEQRKTLLAQIQEKGCSSRLQLLRRLQFLVELKNDDVEHYSLDYMTKTTKMMDNFIHSKRNVCILHEVFRINGPSQIYPIHCWVDLVIFSPLYAPFDNIITMSDLKKTVGLQINIDDDGEYYHGSKNYPGSINYLINSIVKVFLAEKYAENIFKNYCVFPSPVGVRAQTGFEHKRNFGYGSVYPIVGVIFHGDRIYGIG